jgi:hypothetical protein
MKKTFIVLFLLAALMPATSKPIQFSLGNWLWKPASDQALLTTSSPTFAGLTLSGGTASTLAYLNGSKAFTSLANSAGYLLNDGSGGLSWAAVSLSGYLKADGSVALTANWLSNPYQISRLLPVLALTDGATQSITAAQCQNYVIHNGSCTQAIEMDLPAAAIGMQITVYVVAAFTVKLDPNGSDQIMVYTGTAGDYLISDAVAGTCISLVCLQANKWHVAGASGSWTEE